jgi:DNA-binding MarR family transcriptional regulator
MGASVVSAGQASLPTYHSTEEILAHPRFRVARDVMLQGMLALYEHEPFLNRLLLEVGRNILFVVIMCLHARYDEDDRTTWPTLQLVNESMKAFGVGLASPRRIADLVSRLIKTGYLAQNASAHDRRIRILAPTPKMLAQDQDWLISHYAPLQVLFPNPGYGPIMERDPAFQLTQRVVAGSLFAQAGQLMARHPLIFHFMRREAGIMILIKLIELAGAGDTTRDASYSDIGARFGVSRTHVRKLLQEAEKDGLVQVTRGGGHFVRLTPELVQAFDFFIADGMAGHDLVYNLARQAQAQVEADARPRATESPRQAASA